MQTSPSPEYPADSYRELVELDGAHSVRWAKPVLEPRSLKPEPLDLEILALVACMRHVLSSQIHRRFNPGRAATTTQRRLKRLSDAGLVRRFQFHRRDGGGVPMCYAITAARPRAAARPRPAHGGRGGRRARRCPGRPSPAAPVEGDRLLREARHDVHVAGWALALEHAVDGAPLGLRGASESVLSPPLRSTPEGRRALGPADLTLPGGRSPHEFLRTDSAGARVPVERFETVRPDLTIELPGRLRERIAAQARATERGATEGIGAEGVAHESAAGAPGAVAEVGALDLLVELDDRLPTGRGAGKLERYDHLLAGWSVHTTRYGRRLGVPPVGRVRLPRSRPCPGVRARRRRAADRLPRLRRRVSRRLGVPGPGGDPVRGRARRARGRAARLRRPAAAAGGARVRGGRGSAGARGDGRAAGARGEVM